jgi:hypothetical protein
VPLGKRLIDVESSRKKKSSRKNTCEILRNRGNLD